MTIHRDQEALRIKERRRSARAARRDQVKTDEAKSFRQQRRGEDSAARLTETEVYDECFSSFLRFIGNII